MDSKRKVISVLSVLFALLITAAFAACSDSAVGTSGTENEESSSPVTTKEKTADSTIPGQDDENKTVSEMIDDMEILSNEDIKEIKALAYREYIESIDPERENELVSGRVTYVNVNGVEMKVMTRVVGLKPENGYPLYIVLHGGGQDPTGEMNESQWRGMVTRYANSAKNAPGIFVACRAVEDTYNCHSVDKSYMFYDRIIENAIAFMSADPDKCYLVGYSAGGDGVYQIAPRMSDRFAAACMTAGHPNGVSMVNLFNLPFILQVGELDTAYSRNTVTAQYSQILDKLEAENPGMYIHKTFIHSNKEHGVVGDNATSPQTVVSDISAWLASGGRTGAGGQEQANTHAAVLMNEYTRNPLPEKIIWDLSTRTPVLRGNDCFYWLSVDSRISSGTLTISIDKDANSVTVESSTLRKSSSTKVTVYLSEDMLDLFSDITFDFCGQKTTVTPEFSKELLRQTTKERGDENYQFIASFTFNTNGEVV